MKYSPLQYALNLLRQRDRTVGEIYDKMRLKGFAIDKIEVVVTTLKEKRYLDDERFVDNFIKNSQNLGKAGRYKIKNKLELLKVDSKLIEEKLATLDPEGEKNKAKNLANEWLVKKKDIIPQKRYEKLGRFLANRGFELGVVRNVLNEVLEF
jgi:regulatory protein